VTATPGGSAETLPPGRFTWLSAGRERVARERIAVLARHPPRSGVALAWPRASWASHDASMLAGHGRGEGP
jgi:hypothetical protein